MKKIVMLMLVVTAVVFTGCGQSPTAPKPSGTSTDFSTQGQTVILENGAVESDVDLSPNGHDDVKGIGKHQGELKWLDVKIIYLDPQFYTEKGLAGYYIGQPMAFEVHIKNLGPRTFKHLDITAIQEYYESGVCDRWWYPYPQSVTYNKGQALPGDSTQLWQDIEIGPHSEKVLQATFVSPMESCAGLDQTHLIIAHTNQGRELAAAMYYNPEAAVYCPPRPAK